MSQVIPDSWVNSKLEDVVDSIVGGGTPSKAVSSYFQGDIPWMSVKDMNKNELVDTVDHISQEAVENSSTNVIPAGTPIVATRMSLGKIVTASFDSAINQDLKALFVNLNVEKPYLVYWYRSIANLIESLGTGTTVKGIRLEILKGLEFPLPPLAEQKVIADKLDELLAQVESTKARLDAIPAILKSFRQSVLAAAVSGKLTEDNEERNFKTLGEAGVTVKTGPFGSALHKKEYVIDGIPLINPMHINNGAITPANHMTVTKDKFAELSSWKLEPGDIVLGRRGEMGRAAVVPEESKPMLCGTGSMILRSDESVFPEYLCSILRSTVAINYFNKDAVGSTMVNLNQKVIKGLEVFFPPYDEQVKIVRRAEELFAFADKVETQVKKAQTRVNNLTQSILAKAFRGELTADWRTANPELISGENSAAALLERIKVERDKLKPVKKTRAKKAKA
ncbi:hypothetical protein BEL05_15580 [Shewanella colwelliana]|uniref:Type I restriction modification DNA specificity domain-containing protein n=1 Tax=Shewanella colwelliana TaxID=23 RepID=A0A1E5ITH7_SHECO|nr:restriction endonuclease subunit S [Shewanella colwelliana]OEG73869.1 hypothetical protein BEL05_15580 [Shewanella colwelliana]